MTTRAEFRIEMCQYGVAGASNVREPPRQGVSRCPLSLPSLPRFGLLGSLAKQAEKKLNVARFLQERGLRQPR